MSLYAIILNKPDQAAWDNVKSVWSTYHIVDDRLAFIKEDDTLTADVARKVGIGADGTSGMVIQLNFFSGHTSSSLVEWISKNND